MKLSRYAALYIHCYSSLCLYSSHELGNDNVRSRNDVADCGLAVRVRNTELEGSADEVLQGETHNLSRFSAGARVFCYRCNDVSPPLSRAALQQCHKCLLATLLRDELRMSRCAASVYITRVTVCHSALPVTSPRMDRRSVVSHSPAPTLITNIR